MDTNKGGVAELLGRDEVACDDEDVVACLDEGVLSCLYKNIKDGFDVDFLYAHPLEYPLEETLGKNAYSNMVICRKLSDVRPMSTYVIIITIKSDDMPRSIE